MVTGRERPKVKEKNKEKRARSYRRRQEESRCKLGLSGSRLQLEDKSFPRDSCTPGSKTRDEARIEKMPAWKKVEGGASWDGTSLTVK